MVEYAPDFAMALQGVIEKDPSLEAIVNKHTFPAFLSPKPTGESSFEYLVRSIISQQVSGAAGNAILKKFRTLMGCSDDEFPDPERVLKFDVDALRSGGLSLRKAEYIQGLATIYCNGELKDEMFETLSNEEVTALITAVRGLGPWTAQMFLIFYLHRMDVFSPGDVGVQRGMRRYLESRPHLAVEIAPLKTKSKKRSKNQPDIDIEKVAAMFSPYRTAFQMILWKLSDIEMDTVEARNSDHKKKGPKRVKLNSSENENIGSNQEHMAEINKE